MSTAQRTLRAAGLLTGIALAATLLFALRAPTSTGALGAGVRLTAVPPGDLTVPKRQFLVARNLVAGGRAARGALRLRNISSGAVHARLRLRPEGRLLDRGLNVRLTAANRTLAAGSLGSLRQWSRPALVPDAGAIKVRALVYVASGAHDYQGRTVDAAVEIRTTLAKGAR